jgi:2-polyprenyl-3-methyl-5-hydroxy-6-metoxy-1,4-benzoquinol methylase
MTALHPPDKTRHEAGLPRQYQRSRSLKITRSDQEDFEFLAMTARAAKAQKLDRFLHLDQPVGIWNYIRIANEIAGRIPVGRLLDWGCGFGQMTYLLRRRGFDVTPFDIGSADTPVPDLPLTRDLHVVRTTHPTQLPFGDGSFDAVLSCGVLEHVDEFSQPGNEVLSLHEIRRVLKPGGYFPIYQLPQRYTWQEAVTRTLRLGYSHPRRFTAREIRALLDRTGYRIESLRRKNLLPKNLTGVPEPVRAFYSRFSHAIIRVDASLSTIPLLNQVAGVMEIMARRDS